MNSEPYSLIKFRNYIEKSQLFTLAEATKNPSVILPVLLFLQSSLNPEMFVRLISKNSSVVSVLLDYLKKRKQYRELLNLYRLLNKPNEEAKLLISLAYTSSDLETRRKYLDDVIAFCNGKESLQFFADQSKDQLALLERQIPIEQYDSKMALSGELIYQKHPRNNIIASTLNTTLEYCLFYHPNVPKEKLSSPIGMRESFGISEKRYTYCSIRSRSHIADWEAVKEIGCSKTKGIFQKSYHSPIGFEPFVTQIQVNHGPEDLALFFARLVEPEERRFGCAMDHRLFDVALEVVISMKDRNKANEFKSTIIGILGAEKSLAWRLKLDEALSNPKIKWKN